MTTVAVDRDLCANYGQCVFAAPDVFSFDEDEELQYDPHPPPSQQDAVLIALSACPVRAITLMEKA